MIDIPKPNWQPSEVESLEDIKARACEYTNFQRAFVIYQSGTVVFFFFFYPRRAEDYNVILVSVVLQPPDFSVVPTKDNYYLFRFLGPVVGIVLSDFFVLNRDSILRNISDGGLLPGEHLLPRDDHQIQKEHYYIGLYARAKLYSDVTSQIISKRFYTGP